MSIAVDTSGTSFQFADDDITFEDDDASVFVKKSASTNVPSRKSGLSLDLLSSLPKSIDDKLINNQYRILRQIGKGSFGVVFVVTDVRKPNSEFALKMSTCETTDILNLTLQEFSTFKNIHHPNLVELKNAFVYTTESALSDKIETHACLLMDFFSEGDLDQQIKSRTERYSEATLCSYMLQLLAGVAHMHSKGLMHRDLKPGNVFVKNNGQVLAIGDFGLAREMDDSFASTLAGTMRYIAPEVVLTQNYSYDADVWSLGCIFLELAQLGLSSNLYMEIYTNKNFAADIRKRLAHYGPELSDLIIDLLRAEPKERVSLQHAIERVEKYESSQSAMDMTTIEMLVNLIKTERTVDSVYQALSEARQLVLNGHQARLRFKDLNGPTIVMELMNKFQDEKIDMECFRFFIDFINLSVEVYDAKWIRTVSSRLSKFETVSEEYAAQFLDMFLVWKEDYIASQASKVAMEVTYLALVESKFFIRLTSWIDTFASNIILQEKFQMILWQFDAHMAEGLRSARNQSIKHILQIIRQFAYNEPVMEVTARVIYLISQYEPTSHHRQHYFKDMDGLIYTLEMMERNIKSKKIQLLCLKSLQCFVTRNMFNDRVVSGIVNAMNNYRFDDEINLCALDCLCNVATWNGINVQPVVAESISCINTFSDFDNLKELAMRVLASIVAVKESCLTLWNMVEVTQVSTAMLDVKPDISALFIRNMTYEKEGCQVINRIGGVDAILEVIKKITDRQGSKHCIVAFQNMAKHGYGRSDTKVALAMINHIVKYELHMTSTITSVFLTDGVTYYSKKPDGTAFADEGLVDILWEYRKELQPEKILATCFDLDDKLFGNLLAYEYSKLLVIIDQVSVIDIPKSEIENQNCIVQISIGKQVEEITNTAEFKFQGRRGIIVDDETENLVIELFALKGNKRRSVGKSVVPVNCITKRWYDIKMIDREGMIRCTLHPVVFGFEGRGSYKPLKKPSSELRKVSIMRKHSIPELK